MKRIIIDGANMDIDLTSGDKTSWKQTKCPWNEAEKVNTHNALLKMSQSVIISVE